MTFGLSILFSLTLLFIYFGFYFLLQARSEGDGGLGSAILGIACYVIAVIMFIASVAAYVYKVRNS